MIIQEGLRDILHPTVPARGTSGMAFFFCFIPFKLIKTFDILCENLGLMQNIDNS
jgi:hypothetical protein